MREFSRISFRKALIPSQGPHYHDLFTSPRPYLQILPHRQLVSTYEFWGDADIQSVAVSFPLAHVCKVSPWWIWAPGGDSPALTSTLSGAQQTETLLCVPFASQPTFPLMDSSESLFILFRVLLVAGGRNTTQTDLWREEREEKRKGLGRAKGRLRKGILLAHRLEGGRSSHVAGWRSHWFICHPVLFTLIFRTGILSLVLFTLIFHTGILWADGKMTSGQLLRAYPWPIEVVQRTSFSFLVSALGWGLSEPSWVPWPGQSMTLPLKRMEGS